MTTKEVKEKKRKNYTMMTKQQQVQWQWRQDFLFHEQSLQDVADIFVFVFWTSLLSFKIQNGSSSADSEMTYKACMVGI